MKAIVRRRHRARQDLVAVFQHYAREAGLKTARRFLAQAEASFARLAAMPGLGATYEPEHPAFAGIRVFPITRFKKYLVFYLPISNGIDVVRVLHGARDIPHILADDFGVEAADDDGPED